MALPIATLVWASIVESAPIGLYGFPPSSHATARLKTCLKMLGKIKNDKMRSSINSLNKNDINNLKSALTLSGLQIKNHII